MAQLVEALRYKSEGRGFDSRCHWNFFIDIILPAALWALGSTQPVTEMSTRNILCGEPSGSVQAYNGIALSFTGLSGLG